MPRMRAKRLRIAVLTTGRQDWGLLYGLCRLLQAAPDFELTVLAGGMACSARHGRTLDAIRADGFPRVEVLAWDLEQDVERQTAAALAHVGAALRVHAPDALLVLGDRFETAAGALAAAVLGIPIVHLYGGEETEGAIDNALRHAITKLAHLHFVAHADYARRVLCMGEPSSSVHMVGSTAIDNCLDLALPERAELEATLGVSLGSPLGVVTVHPTTLPRDGAASEVDVVLEVLADRAGTWVLTLPNADPGQREIRDAILRFAQQRPRLAVVEALGMRGYLGLVRQCDVVLGNSSSGLVEPAFFGVPTLNIGDRQRGRVRGASVIDVPVEREALERALARALSPEFRASVPTGASIFGDGRAALRMLEILREWEPPSPARKVFHPCAHASL